MSGAGAGGDLKRDYSPVLKVGMWFIMPRLRHHEHWG